MACVSSTFGGPERSYPELVGKLHSREKSCQRELTTAKSEESSGREVNRRNE